MALLEPLPFVAENRRLRDELSLLYRDLESLMTTGAVVAFTVAATAWLAVIVGGDLVDRFDGAVEVLAVVLAYVAYLSSALAAGWAAFAFASSFRPCAPACPEVDARGGVRRTTPER